METWNKQEFLENSIWYHGTSIYGLRSILRNGLSAKFNAKNRLDFGYGVYFTPNEQWTREYVTRITRADQDFSEDEMGVIIVFHFRPIDLGVSYDHIPFFAKLDDTFCDFVFRNRMYTRYHPITHSVHHYPIVAGVMSDGNQDNDFAEYENHVISKKELYRRLKIPKEDWQLTIHKQALCNKIKPFAAYNLKGDEFDVSAYKTIQ